MAVAIRRPVHGAGRRMSMRISMYHKGVGVSAKLTTLIKILAPIAVIGWAFYFWIYPTHAMTLFDDSFESEVLRGTWEDYAGCTRGVVQSTDFSTHGVWSLSADRTGAEPDCTNQVRTGLGTYEGNSIYLTWNMMATEVNISIAGVEFLDDTGVAITHAYFQADELDLDSNDLPVTDLTWYNVRTLVDFTTGCSTSSLDGGSWTTPACGITGSNIAQFRVFAAGTISTILYVDDLRMIVTDLVVGGGDGGLLPPEFDVFLGTDDPLSISDVIADYPTHDDIHGSCSIWGGIFSGSTGDGAGCIWSWIQYALVPESTSLQGLLAVPTSTLTTRWPFSYITQPFIAIQAGLETSDCPFPVFMEDTEFFGTTMPEIDVCTMLEEADLVTTVQSSTWAEAMIIYGIYCGLGLILWKRAEKFFINN